MMEAVKKLWYCIALASKEMRRDPKIVHAAEASHRTAVANCVGCGDKLCRLATTSCNGWPPLLPGRVACGRSFCGIFDYGKLATAEWIASSWTTDNGQRRVI